MKTIEVAFFLSLHAAQFFSVHSKADPKCFPSSINPNVEDKPKNVPPRSLPSEKNDDSHLRALPGWKYVEDANQYCGRIHTINIVSKDGNQFYTSEVFGHATKSGGETPWYARPFEGAKKAASCGASLITTRHVITAAHCQVDSWMFLQLGSAATSKLVRIKEKIVHPNFTANYIPVNDIALLTLAEDVKFADGVAPACLPIGKLYGETFVGHDAMAAGYPEPTVLGQGANVRQSVPWSILENTACRRDSPVQWTVPETSQICARRLQPSPCLLDSGSGLLTWDKYKSRFTILGVASYGEHCSGSDRIVGVFTRITNYLEWILTNMEPTPGKSPLKDNPSRLKDNPNRMKDNPTVDKPEKKTVPPTGENEDIPPGGEYDDTYEYSDEVDDLPMKLVNGAGIKSPPTLPPRPPPSPSSPPPPPPPTTTTPPPPSTTKKPGASFCG